MTQTDKLEQAANPRRVGLRGAEGKGSRATGEGERAFQEEGARPQEVGLERAGPEPWRRECVKLPGEVKEWLRASRLNSDT